MNRSNMYKLNLLTPLILLSVLVFQLVAAAAANHEATINEYGDVILENSSDDDGGDESESIPEDEWLSILIYNESPHRVDVYLEDDEYGEWAATIEPDSSRTAEALFGDVLYVTKHGVGEQLFIDVDTPAESRVTFQVDEADQQFTIPKDSAPSNDLCQDRFPVCAIQAADGGCEEAPGWMIVHCCKSCDSYINSRELMDPLKRCSKEHLNTPEPVWKAGDLNKMFDSWVGNTSLFELYGMEVVSAPDCEKYGATWEHCKEGSPWVILFNNFLDEAEISDLILGGEMEGFERSTDQGEANALGEQEKIVSQTRTSSNAWCMYECEQLMGVISATKKIEDITGIPKENYESFQLLNYEPNQFYRSHHDSSSRDDTPPGPRILTFFLYLSDVEEGGETYFSKLDLSVKPKKGRALVWPSVIDSDPKFWDKRMYHEAKDVIKGKKLAANHWIHLNDYVTPNEWGCTGSFS